MAEIRLKYKCLFLSVLFFSMMFAGCSKKTEKQTSSMDYLNELVFSHLDEAEKNQYSLADYLEFTKPYGIWDMRPKSLEKIDIHGKTATGTEVSFYHFGFFCAYFGVKEENIFEPTDNFFNELTYKEEILKENASNYEKELKELVSRIKDNNRYLIISHKSYQRVDDVFLEGGKYWKYEIPKDSPFNISTEKIYLKDTTFSERDREILKKLKDLRLYGIVNSDNAVVIIIDGLLGYSYGYIFSALGPDSINLGPLFHFRKLEKVKENPDTYFFISN